MPTTFEYDDAGPWIIKDPDATLDYTLDWDVSGDSWLSGDVIAAAPVWTVTPGLTIVSQANTTTTATVWLAGGTAGQTYTASCKITTGAGRVDERSFRLKIENR